MADIDGNNQIDYEEFMKHFPDMLKWIRFHRVIEKALSEMDNIKEEEGIPIEQIVKEEEESKHN